MRAASKEVPCLLPSRSFSGLQRNQLAAYALGGMLTRAAHSTGHSPLETVVLGNCQVPRQELQRPSIREETVNESCGTSGVSREGTPYP